MGGHVNLTGKVLAAAVVADAAAGGSAWKQVGCFAVLWALFVLGFIAGFVMWIFS